MAYTVNKTNSSASPNQYTVQDGVVNEQTDLKLIGKGYAGYGELIGENFLHLLENFSNPSAPSKPISGQLWWDSSTSKLKVYTGTAWQASGGSAPYQFTFLEASRGLFGVIYHGKISFKYWKLRLVKLY